MIKSDHFWENRKYFVSGFRNKNAWFISPKKRAHILAHSESFCWRKSVRIVKKTTCFVCFWEIEYLGFIIKGRKFGSFSRLTWKKALTWFMFCTPLFFKFGTIWHNSTEFNWFWTSSSLNSTLFSHYFDQNCRDCPWSWALSTKSQRLERPDFQLPRDLVD